MDTSEFIGEAANFTANTELLSCKALKMYIYKTYN